MSSSGHAMTRAAWSDPFATLHPHQRDLVERVREAFRASRSVVMQLGTGGGKTFCASAILASAIARGHRCLFLAHLDALLEDTSERLARAGIPCGLLQADRPTDPTAPVQVASLATLARRPDTRPPADLVILDESHRCMAVTVRGVLDAYPRAKLLGLTATPQRGDGQPLGDVFDRLVSGPSVRWLTDHGYLVPCDVRAPPQPVDEGLWLDPVDALERYAPPTARALVFASSIEHAEDVARRCTERGRTAATLTGETPRAVRRELRARMAAGDLGALVGVGVFIEGFDLPSVDTIVLARSLSVVGSFLQAVGRGLRTSPGTSKVRCLVLDLKGAALLHGLPDEDRTWSLTGEAVRRAEKMTALARCRECLAVFRPTARCPRCGAGREAVAKLPRNLNRAERLERIAHLPQWAKDERYLRSLEYVARARIKLPEHRCAAWALTRFRKQFARDPEMRPSDA